MNCANTKFKTDEFDKLVHMLEEAGIPFEKTISESEGDILCNLRYPNYAKTKLSVSLGRGGFGGTYGSCLGLLETWTMRNLEQPIGFRSADEVFAEIQQMERSGEKLKAAFFQSRINLDIQGV